MSSNSQCTQIKLLLVSVSLCLLILLFLWSPFRETGASYPENRISGIAEPAFLEEFSSHSHQDELNRTESQYKVINYNLDDHHKAASNIIYQSHDSHNQDASNWTTLLSFLHMDSHSVCERIFTEPAGSKYKEVLKPYYDLLNEEHEGVVSSLMKKNGKHCLVGSSKFYPEETYVMWQLARLPFVKTVCETGFNAGFSTHLWLAANPDIHVYSFDIGQLACSRPMAEFITSKYPGRVNITWGDSTKTLPKFIAQNPNIKCDLMVIDGGHIYSVAKQDRMNFYKMASSPLNVVLIDNYPDLRFKNELAHAWDEGVRSGQVAEMFRCHYKTYNQGFSFGRFVL